jgi:DMSO/TMAO reductase YedYZ molybdopterin-dependent catalytic subunit
MNKKEMLPPGQKESTIFPRFGLPKYANRFPKNTDSVGFSIGGDLEDFEIGEELSSLPRTAQVSDFHCVTTWSKLNLNWSGYKFNDFYNAFILPKVSHDISFVIIMAQDGYKTSLPLIDLLKQNVLLADQLDNQPLTIEHGAPIRIVAPDHYGYKNLKHIKRIEFYAKKQVVKKGYLRFMDHSRARVAQEERASKGPRILFRWLYKFGIKGTIRDFDNAMVAHRAKMQAEEKD